METGMDLVKDTKSLPLSLRSSTRQDPSPDDFQEVSIAALLHRIGRQRGSFRNFTEESLLKELEEGKTQAATPDATSAEPENLPQNAFETSEDVLGDAKIKDKAVDDTSTPTLETAVRDQVVQLLATALNESALALDFASLLLSSTRQAAADSMSPALKAAVPAGSLTHTRVRRPPSSTAAEPTSTILGFKARGLSSAATALRHSSRETAENHDTDAHFWAEVQALKQAGWDVFKPRTGQAGIAVRFGPLQRHAILLKKDALGRIDASDFDDKRILLQLSIKSGSKTMLSRREESDKSETANDEEPLILRHLRRARKSVLNSNIFDDLVKEARSIANLGLTIIDRTITIPLGSDMQVCIDLLEIEGGLTDRPDEVEDTDMTDHESVETTHSALLGSLAAMIYSRYTSSPKKHCLRTFMSCHRHGRLIEQLQRSISSLMTGLSSLEWSLKSLHSMTHAPAPQNDWDGPSKTNILVTFLTREISIAVETSLDSITTYTAVSSSIAVTGVPVVQRRTTAHESRRVMELIKLEVMEAIQEVLSLTDGIVRCAESAVRIDGQVIIINISLAGKIKLIKNGESKDVEQNLVLEIMDQDGYQA